MSYWVSLRNALMLTPIVATLGGVVFLFAAIFIVQDRRRAEATIECRSICLIGAIFKGESFFVDTSASDDLGLSEKMPYE